MVLPAVVAEAQRRATDSGFTLSCEPGVGALLATLAAATPDGGRILELGTGVGVGLAWIVEGLGGRDDVEVVSVDVDESVQAVARTGSWPANVTFEVGDGADLVGRLGPSDLVFADAPGGKIVGLEKTIAALRPGGVLVVDDMDLDRHEDPQLRRALAGVRERLLAHDAVVCAELDYSSGVMIATRRH
jgi:demethylmenaquinone methyltransferase/2-methoxy-6-polyprenyl-1,4-benzoquinol methylase